MKKYLLFTVLTALTIVSCSKNDVIEDTSESNAITFDTYIGNTPVSRASEATASTIKSDASGFGVFAHHTGTTGWNNQTTSVDFNFMRNTQVTYDETNGWHYDNTKYWPSDADEKISFFAYYPYKSDAANNVSAGTLTFAINWDIASQVDFLYTADLIDQTKTTGKDGLKFPFHHALSRVALSVTSDAAIAGSKIEIVSVTLGKTGTSTFNSLGVFNLLTGNWVSTTKDANNKTFVFEKTAFGIDQNLSEENQTGATGGEFTTVDGNEAKDFVRTTDANYLMLIPQDFSAENAGLPVSVSYKITAPGSSVAIANTVEGTFNQTLVKSTAYVINIKITPNAVVFGEPTVSAWVPSNSTEENKEVTVQ